MSQWHSFTSRAAQKARPFPALVLTKKSLSRNQVAAPFLLSEVAQSLELALGFTILQRGRSKGQKGCWGCSQGTPKTSYHTAWVVLKIMGPFWIYSILRHLMFRGTKMGPYFGNIQILQAVQESRSQLSIF